jgi:hypothetical protein
VTVIVLEFGEAIDPETLNVALDANEPDTRIKRVEPSTQDPRTASVVTTPLSVANTRSSGRSPAPTATPPPAASP